MAALGLAAAAAAPRNTHDSSGEARAPVVTSVIAHKVRKLINTIGCHGVHESGVKREYHSGISVKIKITSQENALRL